MLNAPATGNGVGVEEDPAAAFLAQQESEIAGIENDEGFSILDSGEVPSSLTDSNGGCTTPQHQFTLTLVIPIGHIDRLHCPNMSQYVPKLDAFSRLANVSYACVAIINTLASNTILCSQ